MNEAKKVKQMATIYMFTGNRSAIKAETWHFSESVIPLQWHKDRISDTTWRLITLEDQSRP